MHARYVQSYTHEHILLLMALLLISHTDTQTHNLDTGIKVGACGGNWAARMTCDDDDDDEGA